MMKTTLVLAAVALASVLGCDYEDRTSRPVDRSPAPTGPAVSSPADSGTPSSGPSTMNEADRMLAQRVSDILRQEGPLSSAAQNITVHASNGKVTLRGSVSSQQEKNDIEAKAKQVAGVNQVDNQLEVASASR